MGNARTVVGWLLLCAMAIAATRQAFTISYLPSGAASYDVADYLNQGWNFRKAFLDADIATALTLFTAPNIHPPGHALALGAWSALAGYHMPSLLWFEAFAFLSAMAGLVWLGHGLDETYGRWAGALTAVLTLLSSEHQRLFAAPMTENLALIVTIGALRAARPRGNAATDLVAGLCILAAGLVRYNLVPMLLVPLLAARFFSGLGSLIRAAILCALPSCAYFGAWLHFGHPETRLRIADFFRNVDSGLDPWSWENLAWVPTTLADGYYGISVTALLTTVFLLGTIRCVRDVRLRVPYAYVACACVAITFHPYKLPRTLHGVAPFLVLCAALSAGRWVAESAGRARAALSVGGVTVGLTAGVALFWRNRDPETRAPTELVDSQVHLAALNFIVSKTETSRRVAVVGESHMVHRETLLLWYHLADSDPDVVYDQSLPEACDGISSTSDCVPANARTAMSEAARWLDPAVVVLLPPDREGPKRPRRQVAEGRRDMAWTRRAATAISAVATDSGFGSAAQTDLPRGKGRILVFRRDP